MSKIQTVGNSIGQVSRVFFFFLVKRLQEKKRGEIKREGTQRLKENSETCQPVIYIIYLLIETWKKMTFMDI